MALFESSSVDDRCPKNFMEPLRICLKIGASHPWFRRPTRTWHRIVNWFYFLLVDILSIQMSIGAYYYLYINWEGSISQVSTVQTTAILYLVTFLMVVYQQLRASDMVSLMDYAETRLQFHSVRGLSVMSAAGPYKLIKPIVFTINACTLPAALYWIIGGMFDKNEDGSRSLPLPVASPFNLDDPIQYWLACSIQLLGQVIGGIVYANTASMMACMCLVSCTQFALACCGAENAMHAAMLRSGVPHSEMVERNAAAVTRDRYLDYFVGQPKVVDSQYDVVQGVEVDIRHSELVAPTGDFFTDFSFGRYDEEMRRVLADSSALHVATRAFIRRFEDLYSVPMFVETVGMIEFICVTLFSVMHDHSYKQGIYLFTGLCHHFVLCFFGNQMVLESMKMRDAVWCSGWQQAGPRVRRVALLMLLEQNGPPVEFRGGGLFPLDLNNCLVIIKTAFSFYTFLRNIT